jgi:tRNA threonylcarbamoyladenosine biosynthesis protein TsaB
MTPQLLAIDASTDRVELALGWQGREHFATLAAGAQASAQLLPALQALCAQAGARLDELDAIAYGAGPGAFTGLRTACAAAQGLAYGLDCPVLALDTLAAVAESAAALGAPERLWATLDARMGEIYAARLRRTGPGCWQTERPAALYTPEALLAELDAQDVLAGPALGVYAALNSAAGGPHWPQARPDGPALLRVAAGAWRAGAAIAAHQALPVYVRNKVAETTAERAERRAPSPAALA